LQEEHITVGAELGDQKGLFSVEMLKRWPSCKEYHLVDLWAHQENYVDSANVRPRMQENFYEETLRNINNWTDKIHICRNYTSECVKEMSDSYFEFI